MKVGKNVSWLLAWAAIAGHMRVEACKRLGWRSVPAVVRNRAPGTELDERPPQA